MNNSQSIINFNNQSSERNAKMVNKVAVCRITDEVMNTYSEELRNGLSLGLKRHQVASLAYSFICDKYGIEGELTPHERGLLGKVAGAVYRDHVKPKLKKCTRCGDSKPFVMFSKDKDSSDGKQSWCKECYRQYNSDKRQSFKQETASLTDLFQSKEIVIEDISMLFTRNNMQVRYINSEFLYSPVEGSQFNDSDVEDLLILRALAKSKVEKFNGAN